MKHSFRTLGFLTLLIISTAGAALWLWPRILLFLHTVSTDDAYVAGHVTYIAPRVPGTILKIHVDDNQFVTKGQLLVELDPEPYEIGVARRCCCGCRWRSSGSASGNTKPGNRGRHPGSI